MPTASIILVLIPFLAWNGPGPAAPSYTGDLSGSEVVPPTESTATAHLELIGYCNESAPDSTTILFNLWQIGLGDELNVYLAHGAEETNGPTLHTIVSGPFWLTSGTLALSPEHCEWLNAGDLYVIVTSREYPDGEIRAQVIPAFSPVLPQTWGRVKSVFRGPPER